MSPQALPRRQCKVRSRRLCRHEAQSLRDQKDLAAAPRQGPSLWGEAALGPGRVPGPEARRARAESPPSAAWAAGEFAEHQ